MDKLLALKMFVETVRCGGYSSAARKLGISTSSVTRQVAGLESELGASLLNRTTRNTSVTVAGQHYFDKVVAILEPSMARMPSLPTVAAKLRAFAGQCPGGIRPANHRPALGAVA